MSPLRNMASDERGMALVIALLAVIILGGLATVFVATAMTESRVTGIGRDHEVAIHVAEAASDAAVARVNVDKAWYTTGDDGAYELPAGLDEDAQKVWVLDVVLNDDSLDPLVTGTSGEGFAIRPVDEDGEPLDMIFGVGFVPSRDNAQRTRIIKLRYDRVTFSAKQAILACGDMDIGGSGTVEGLQGNVHSNGAIHITGTGHSIAQKLSATGGLTGNDPNAGDVEEGSMAEHCPTLSAEDFYGRSVPPYTCYPGVAGCEGMPTDVLWWDLCPDGTARQAGPSPCTGTPVFDQSKKGAGNHLGWSYKLQQGRVTWSVQNIQPGVFYIHEGDASITGQGSGRVTLFTAMKETDEGRSGNISFQGRGKIQPAIEGMLFVADRDLDVQGTAGAGGSGAELQGFLAAGEQVKMHGNAAFSGSVYAADAPHTQHSPVAKTSLSGNFKVKFDTELDVPLLGVIRITAWNEL
jgi:hypothetical protein